MNFQVKKSDYKVGYQFVFICIVFFALLLVPAPLLPPHHFAESIQSKLGFSWPKAYLVATIVLQGFFYFSVGILSAFVVKRAPGFWERLIQMMVVPLAIVLVASIIRFVKVGHIPIWINTVIPVTALLLGVWVGLGFLYHRGKIILFIVVVMMAASLWFLLGGAPAELNSRTEKKLMNLVVASKTIPSGEARFGALLQIAFAPLSGKSEKLSAVQQNRAAILALGIALGDEQLSKFIGLKPESPLVRQAILLSGSTTLYARNDWVKHFTVSAALAVLEHPLISDAAGLMKEQLDALTGGTGFSFADFAADRAGVRFAMAATNSEEDAKAMQELLKSDFVVSNFFPPVADLPESLTTKEFRKHYSRVGSLAYRQKISEIENRLNNCKALSPLYSGKR